MSDAFQSWGRFPRAARQAAHPIVWQTDRLPATSGTLLPYGQGRSYGDSCLNEGGTLLTTATLDRLLGFDAATGVVRCEAGVTLDTLLRLAVPRGWFLPVTPGTKFVSVGGAIANDVHGKNHHRAGTFGRYVRRFELLRSDGSRRVCSPEENPDWYEATVGGLGLTGLILWAEVQLRPIHNPFVLTETVPLENLDAFFAVSRESEPDHEFTVAWVDSLARGRKVGRGLFYRGNFAPPQFDGLPLAKSHLSHGSGLAVPFDMPGFSLNRLSVAAFNALYYRANVLKRGQRLQHYDPFFYPLDAVQGWNRIYGRDGFLQFQCVVPHATARAAIQEILERSAREVPSFLNVLKTFGGVPSPGWLSFPRPGVTLALDFANRGERTWRLVAELDRITREAGGAVYPAKDARMSAESFATYFPQLERFKAYVDPAFSSSFWRRVTVAPAVQPAALPLQEGAPLPAVPLRSSL
ncbi:FAD-binding oxidoreductase [Hyalangium rubrum]|uniref:FAD-binding oxidoreductase n=1 Tax=Hyalangium rubrum TaxID=3103134 RepID=A0ABU5H2D4_9BACT|nr:FAD-binding oxidoreductase [Hyalangium sp. s54d21]MDY7227628.1 FAD-binding oxidoreductase [Hyalangium sp. s54d21]